MDPVVPRFGQVGRNPDHTVAVLDEKTGGLVAKRPLHPRNHAFLYVSGATAPFRIQFVAGEDHAQGISEFLLARGPQHIGLRGLGRPSRNLTQFPAELDQFGRLGWDGHGDIRVASGTGTAAVVAGNPPYSAEQRRHYNRK